MANVGRLSATLSLNSAAFSKGLKSAGGGFEKFTHLLKSGGGGRLAGLIGTGAKMGAGFAIAGAAISAVTGLVGGLFRAVERAGGKISELTRSSMENIDTLGKMSERINISTEALSGLQHAAALADLPMENLEVGLKKFSKAMSAADAGSKTMKQTFGSLGLDAEKLTQMPLDGALNSVADALLNVDNQNDRVRLSMELFGKSGDRMLTMLQGGSAGLRGMRADADKLSLTFSNMDFHKVERANDAITRVGKAASGIGNLFAIRLSGSVEGFADAMTNSVIRGKNEFSGLATIIKATGNAINGLAASTAALEANFQRIAIWKLKFDKLMNVQGWFDGTPEIDAEISKREETIANIGRDEIERLGKQFLGDRFALGPMRKHEILGGDGFGGNFKAIPGFESGSADARGAMLGILGRGRDGAAKDGTLQRIERLMQQVARNTEPGGARF